MDNQQLQQETQKLLDMMNVHYKEVTIDSDNDLHLIFINIRTTQDTEIFFENNKSLLRDFGNIAKQIFSKRFHYFKSIIFDINETEQKFINFTKEKASLALERVRFFDKPYEFGYLNSYERMVIHSYLKKHQDISTESVGEGKERRLVIKKNT